MDSESNCGNTICFSVFDQDPKGNIDISKVKGFCFCEHGVGKNKSILLKYYSRRRQNYIIGIQEINNFFFAVNSIVFHSFFLPIKNEKTTIGNRCWVDSASGSIVKNKKQPTQITVAGTLAGLVIAIESQAKK